MQEYLIKRRRGPHTLLGTFIIHLGAGFVNIHFVRFFVVIFGEKYRVKNLRAFVVVLFVDFLQSGLVAVVSQVEKSVAGGEIGHLTALICDVRVISRGDLAFPKKIFKTY